MSEPPAPGRQPIKHQVVASKVVGSRRAPITSDDPVAVVDEGCGQSSAVGQHLRLVGLELGRHGLFQGHSDTCRMGDKKRRKKGRLKDASDSEVGEFGEWSTCDGVIVRASLQSWEHGLVDQRLQVVQGLLPLGVHTAHACSTEDRWLLESSERCSTTSR